MPFQAFGVYYENIELNLGEDGKGVRITYVHGPAPFPVEWQAAIAAGTPLPAQLPAGYMRDSPLYSSLPLLKSYAEAQYQETYASPVYMMVQGLIMWRGRNPAMSNRLALVGKGWSFDPFAASPFGSI